MKLAPSRAKVHAAYHSGCWLFCDRVKEQGFSAERMPQLPPSEGGGHGDPARLGLQDADSPAHVPVTPQPQWPVPESYNCTGRLLPGRQRILASAARQLAASEMLLEGLDVCALDLNTHALPPPLMPVWEAQQDLEKDKSSALHRRQALELLRLHALLQAAVGEEQDLVVVGLHQVATQYRHDWASCVAAAFAAAEGQALTAIRRHMLGPQAAADDSASSSASAPPRTTSFANYEQIVPLNAYPHHNQLLLVYVHPSHLHKVTLLSIAKSRLGSYCCRDLQQNYKQQWGFSAAEQQRLRRKWQQQQTEQHQRQRQQRMDLFFNFNFFGLSESAPAAADSNDSAVPESEQGSPGGDEPLTESASGAALESWGLSSQQQKRQQRIKQQRLKDCICCNSICSLSKDSACCRSSSHVHGEASPSSTGDAAQDKCSASASACGCEVYKEVFAYGGMAARLLIGATPVVVACIDLKLTEDALEPCGEGLSCRFCRTAEHLEAAGGAALASAAAATSRKDAEPDCSCEARDCEDHALSAVWRRRVIRALQRQQLLTILADIRFETDSGWASALELKPLLLLGARRQRGFPSACPFSSENGFVASETEGRHDSGSVSEACLHAAAVEQQRRLKELEQLGILTTEDNRFFYCRVPKKPGSQVLSLIESGRAAEWRRKLLVDPPLLQLPPVRPFEPMQLKICLSNPHESLPTAYRVYCLSDSGTPQDERQGLQEGPLSASTSTTHDSSPNKTELLRGAAALAVANETDPKAVLRRRIRLERWLLMDSLHGFLKGGETRVISMTLNIQEGIYSAQELACGVLVLRLVDSRQDFFCCLAASLMPALLGAELQPLALLGPQPLLPEASEDPSTQHGDHQDEHKATNKDSAEVVASTQGKAGEGMGVQTDASGASQLPATQLPLPKELWWLLLHIHAKTLAAASAALEASEESSSCFACKGQHHTKPQDCKGRTSRSAECVASQFENSPRSMWSRSSVGSITGSDSSSQSEEEDCSKSGFRLQHPSAAAQQDHVHSSFNEGLGLDIAMFLCTAGGDTLTWPSFLAGADTYLQPDERLCEMPAAAWTWDGPLSCESHRQGRRKRDAQGRKGHRRSSTDDTAADCESYQPLKRDVAFLRACLERGIAIPEGVPLCAALLAAPDWTTGAAPPSDSVALQLLEEWGATCCFFPSEFAVQDVQTDSLHILCRAILLSLPSVHRNAFISVVSSINELLQTAARSIAAVTQVGSGRKEASKQGQQYASRTDASGSSSVDFASAVGWVGCCSPGEGAAGVGCSQMCLEVLQSGERGGPAQRVNCLESLHTPQLLRHALLLWMGSWLMKSCRPALRHAVLDHFIAPV
ncbi:hypothetical protein Emed_003882 [Eimeria media]